MELLHEVAFGQHSSGNGLGFSLYSPADRIGSHSFDQIMQFHEDYLIGKNCALVLMGADTFLDSMDVLNDVQGALRNSNQLPKLKKASHNFVGGNL